MPYSHRSDIRRDINTPTLNRLPIYLNFLSIKKQEGLCHIPSTVIASELKMNSVKVRKDLEKIGCVGTPKTGFSIEELISQINRILGYNNVNDVILTGVGKLGNTLLTYKGFEEYGLNIVAAFDVDRKSCGRSDEKCIFHIDKMKDIVKKMNVHMGIITVPAQNAQEVCDQMVESGILAIWNFAPVHLIAPSNIFIKNDNLAASLALLSRQLTRGTL